MGIRVLWTGWRRARLVYTAASDELNPSGIVRSSGTAAVPRNQGRRHARRARRAARVPLYRDDLTTGGTLPVRSDPPSSSPISGPVARAASSASVAYPQAWTTTPESAPAVAPASPIVRSDRPWADARSSAGTASLSSVEPATIAADQPSPTSVSPAARRAGSWRAVPAMA